MRLDLDQFIFALSNTVDLVGVDEVLHGKRVGYMAWNCAKKLDFPASKAKRLLQLGLLHDCGVSTTKEHHKLVNELDWENSQIHCQIGSDRMKYFGPLHSFAEPILHHHTSWESLKDKQISDEIKIEANLIFLLDRVDYFGQITPGQNWIAKKKIIRDKVRSYAGTYFHPELVDTFLRTSENEAFWICLDPIMLIDFMEQQKKAEDHISVSNDQLKTVAELFAQIVDAKSPFTAEHSLGVSRLASHMAEQSGLNQETCLKIEVAGLLHDLGKLQVPDNVLEKTGPLDDDEFSCMQLHSYVSYQILKKITGFEKIALWAANHHEVLDGSGYPFHRMGDDLDIESRIVAVADIFQALAQNRPYRKARPVGEIISFLQKKAKRGKLDNNLVEMIADTREKCYQTAMVA